MRVGNCAHYNGQGVNETCRAGVNYRQLVKETGPGWTKHLPCFTPYRPHPKVAAERVTCERFVALTEEDVEADHQRRIEARRRWTAQIKAHICRTCGEEVEFIQDGPCVFGSCGHRLFQGKVKK